MDVIKSIEHEQLKNKIPVLDIGNTVRVHVKVKEGNRERIQVFEGIIIKKQGGGLNQTFTVRKISYGVGVEKTFLIHSPLVEKVEVVRVGKARRAKLYYLRERTGKASKTKEMVGARIENKEIVLKEDLVEEPAEEVGKGAKKLIEEKVLEDPKVDNMIIFHFANSDTIGMEIQKDISTATIGRVSINILGKSSHWGDAKEGIDAISISGKVLNIIDKMNNSLKDKGPFILGIGMINGGVKNNIMADSVRLEGTLRAVGDDKFNYLLNYLEEKMKILSEESGAKIEVNLESKLPSVVNDYNLVQIGRKIGEDIFKERFVLGEKVYLAGDNAAYYFQKTPGIRMVFFAKKENEINYPLHNSKFDFNEDIFYYALSTIYQMILSIR